MKHLARRAFLAVASLAALAGLSTVASAQTKTLDTVKQRGQLSCGVNTWTAGVRRARRQGRVVGA